MKTLVNGKSSGRPPSVRRALCLAGYVALLCLVSCVGKSRTAIDARHRIESSQFEQTGEREWTSPVVQAAFPFEELIYSWHLDRPGDTFRLQLKVVFDAGEDSPWLPAGYWGDVPNLVVGRKPPSFEGGVLDMDWLRLDTPATGFQFRVVGMGDNPQLAPPALTVIVTHNHPSPEPASPQGESGAVEPVAARVLDIPLRRQYDSGGQRITNACQSAALASALEYFGRSVTLEDIVAHSFDAEYEYPGVWPRVIGAAQEFGFDGRIERFRDWDAVRRALAKNEVLLCSMRLEPGECDAPPYPSLGNHIVALCGVTDDDRVVVTDSYLGRSGTGYLCQWTRSDFERVWMETKGGVAMVIQPPENAALRLVENLPPFPRDRAFPDGDDH